MGKGLFKPIQRIFAGRKQTSPQPRRHLSRQVIEKALALGASAAGIADVAALRTSPSHHAVTAVRWPPDAASVVVLALEHSPDEPVMDWWDHRTGSTPGNRRLITIGTALVRWLKHEHAIIGRGVPYPIAKGGFFVKDAAVLAGLGVIGRNNLLITPAFGPRVRLRAVLLTTDLIPTGPVKAFAPCDNCPAPCHLNCPQNAFQSGAYDIRRCQRQMALDEAGGGHEQPEHGSNVIRYCRVCELSCIVNRQH